MEDGGPGDRDITRTWPGSEPEGLEGLALPARWQLGRPLGSGGQAQVWLAHDREVGEWVAIKVFRSDLPETDRERVRREVRLGRSLQHPGLVRLFELIEVEGRLALVMEWLAGGNLVHRLEAGPLPIPEVVRVADECLATLAYLHAQGVVHRDVKPSNLLLDGEGGVHLADLGLARPLGDGLDLTRTETTVGTPAFMSPEQLRGETATPAADLYSLGATLYQLLTGVLVFKSGSHFEVARHHLASRAPDPRARRPDCPRWLARFVLRLMEKRPEDRWPDAAAARAALQRRANLTSPRVRRMRAAAGAAALVVVVGAALVGRMVFEAFWHPAAARVEASGAELRGLSRRGDIVWRVAFPNPVQQVERFDPGGTGGFEVVAVAASTRYRRGERHPRSDVAVVDRRGEVVSRIVPEATVRAWPFEYAPDLIPIVSVLGIGRGGAPAVLANCRDRSFYPTVLKVYWPRTGVWESCLYHAGWVHSLTAVPGSRPVRLLFEGVNNRLCMYPVVGELLFTDAEPAEPHAEEAAARVTEAPSLPVQSPFPLSWYTPLDAQGPTGGTLELATDGGAVVRYPSAIRAVDSFGNPVPGPNAGVDLRAERGAFLSDLAALTPGNQPVTAPGVAILLESLRARHAALLRERPYRTILDTLGAAALARAGGLAQGIALLRRLHQVSDAPEVTLRLAHLEGIAGDLDEAKRLAREVLDGANGNRRYDAAQLLRHLSFETRDVAGVRAAATALGYFEQVDAAATGVTAALWAGAHMWWDEMTEVDTKGGGSSFTPAADAVSCVARWRLGRTAPDDLDRMKASEEAYPEARGPCRAARAAALIGLGRPREAAVLVEEIAAHMESTGVDDFDQFQGLGFARALYVKALLAAGDTGQARRIAQKLQPQLRPGLLPRILVDEVIRDTAPPVDGR